MKIKTLYGITSTNFTPYKQIREKAIMKTWVKFLPSHSEHLFLCNDRNDLLSKLIIPLIHLYENIRWTKTGKYIEKFCSLMRVFNLFPTPSSTILDNTVQLQIPESLTLLGYKHLFAIDYMVKTNCDFLIMTNSSSILNVLKIEDFLKLYNPCMDLYAGRRISQYQNFASGSFYILSRKTCERILQSKSAWDHAYLDDIALFKLMNRFSVSFLNLPSVDITSMDILNSYNQVVLQRYFHFKCGPIRSQNGHRMDDYMIKLMNALYQKIVSS